MKKIKKFFSIWLAILLMFCMSISFSGCKKPHTNSNCSYYGIIQTEEESEKLYVFIPYFGLCIFPEYKGGVEVVIKDGRVYEYPLKHGDVVRLDFGEINNPAFGETMQFDENTGKYYTVFTYSMESVWLYKENVSLEKVDDTWFITMDKKDYAYNDEEVCTVGEIAELWTAQFLTGEGDGQGSRQDGIAIIESISDGQITLRLDLDIEIHKFLHYFATGALAFRRISISDLK